ncbi:MAG: hypothetical protein ACHQ4G_03480 [Opitutales bacterium]
MTSQPATIALVGDYQANVLAHQAIPGALAQAGTALGATLAWRWIGSETISDAPRQLAGYAGIWAVPASPYRNSAGVIDAIRFARESGRPFLGTCGGFQHALIEFARHILARPAADTAETNPHGSESVVTALSCALVDRAAPLRFTPGSRLRAAYGRDSAVESYRCSYGLNPAYRERYEAAGLCFTAFDGDGEIRAAELAGHPFFVGTLFQPERAALRDEPAPVVTAFARAVADAVRG